VVKAHLDDDAFSIKTLSAEIGMSHSSLYKKIKSVSGGSVNAFVRFIRLRQVAELLINTEKNVNEAAMESGFNDLKYFREQFHKLFGVTPSEYIRKFRPTFSKNLNVNRDLSQQ
jgi:AraC-like DNA-binding protein